MEKIEIAPGLYVFTQNIKSVRVYETKKNSQNPAEHKICYNMGENHLEFSQPFADEAAAREFVINL